MPELKLLTLCDVAVVRENLLHILGAGITVFRRESYPSAMACTIAVSIQFTSVEEQLIPWSIEVRIGNLDHDDEGFVVFQHDVKPERTAPPGPDDNLPTNIPVIIDGSSIGIKEPGRYKLYVRLSGEEVATVRFDATLETDPRRLFFQG
jgi:hypothetical protein